MIMFFTWSSVVIAKLRQTKRTNLGAAQDVLARLHNWKTEMIEEALCIFFHVYWWRIIILKFHYLNCRNLDHAEVYNGFVKYNYNVSVPWFSLKAENIS